MWKYSIVDDKSAYKSGESVISYDINVIDYNLYTNAISTNTLTIELRDHINHMQNYKKYSKNIRIRYGCR